MTVEVLKALYGKKERALQAAVFVVHLGVVFTAGIRSAEPVGLIFPSSFAFLIWFVVYAWEFAAMWYLVVADKLCFWQGYLPASLWITANVLEATWARLNSSGLLTISPYVEGALAVTLVFLAFTMRNSTGQEYWFLGAPFWLHAGWVTAATIVEYNTLTAHTADTQTQFTIAFVSPILTCVIGLSIVSVTALVTRRLVALLYPAAQCWALIAVLGQFGNPNRISRNPAYAEIGEDGHATLETVVAICLVVLALGTAVTVACGFAKGGYHSLTMST